jgi:hypothetical protein
MKNIRKILFIPAVIFIVYMIYLLFHSFILLSKASEQELPTTFVVPNGYEKVIDSIYLKETKIYSVHNNKQRNPIVFLSYDDKHSIVLYKIGSINKDVNVRDLVNLTFNEINDDFYGTFNGYSDTSLLYELLVNANPIENKLEKIYVNLYGDSLQKIDNQKNIICYYFKLKGFYIKHTQKNEVDMYLTTYENSFSKQRKEISTSILFVNNSGNLFLLLMMPKSFDIKMPPDLLYKMVVK